jgi:hypothetical protein
MQKFSIIIGLAVGMTAAAQAITWRHDINTTFQDQSFVDKFAIGVFQYADTPSDRRSGVLISDRYVLTAAHNFRWGIATTFTIGGQVYQIANFNRHPQYTTAGAANDLAVVRLTKRVTNVVPAPVNFLPGLPSQFIYLGGAGGAGAVTRATSWNWTATVGTNQIAGVQAGTYTTTFDGPGSAATAQESHLMPGDSGGGLFREIDGRIQVIGVATSRIGAGYGATANFTRVDVHRAFIVDRAWESGRVEGKITLGDFVGSTSGIEATVQLFDPITNLKVGQSSMILAPEGSFSFTTPLRGTYNARVFARNWMAKRVNGINIQTNSSTRLNVSLFNGDVTMSGRVDADDVSAVQAAVNSGTGPIRMDVNGDRALSQADVAIVQANFGRRGE